MEYSKEDLEKGRKALLSGGVGSAEPLIIKEAKGASILGYDGREFIDCTSQAWTLNIGHSHPKVIEAVEKQIRCFTHIRTSYETIPKLLLSKKLVELAPGNLNKVNYCLHGSVANEGAIKIALNNKKKPCKFLTLHDGFYGRTLSTMAACWPHPNKNLFPFMHNFVKVPNAYCYRCPFSQEYPSCGLMCTDYIRKTIKKEDTEFAGFMVEPIQGNGGMIDFPAEYHKEIRKICDENNILLIWDEMQTAFGRVGKMFASELYDTIPDIISFGKAIGGGFPLAGNIVRDDIEGFHGGDHSFTFAHFPVSMAAALATLDVIEKEDLLRVCREKGEYITKRLKEMQEKYELIGDIRGPGLMIGIEMVKNGKEPAIKETEKIMEYGFKKGILFGQSKYDHLGNVLKIKPPIVISQEQIDRSLEVFEEAIKSI
ncbi:MAG: aspartate aminotransferase family protein [Nanoarchaeota archaeon]